MPDHRFTFGWEMHPFTRNEHVIVSENFFLFFTLLGFCLILQHLVGKVWRVKYLPECLATMLFAMVIGGAIRLSTDHDDQFSPFVMGFSSDIFYFGFLPPIIFTCGYHLQRKLFYGNLGAVVALAFVGTFCATLLTSVGIRVIQMTSVGAHIQFSFMERIAFACVLSATDPVSTLAIFTNLKVDPALYYAVLGESVLNDAVAITAFRIASRLAGATDLTYMDGVAALVNFFVLVIGSSLIGYTLPILVAYLFRHVRFEKDKIVPIGAVLCTLYMPFFLCEMLQLSGIVAIFFAGIASRRYVHKNLSVEVRKIATFVFHLLSHVSETSCFVLLGLSVFLVDFPLNRLPFMVAVLLVCSVTRPLSVYPLIGLLNAYRTLSIATTTSGSSPSVRSALSSSSYGAVPNSDCSMEIGTVSHSLIHQDANTCTAAAPVAASTSSPAQSPPQPPLPQRKFSETPSLPLTQPISVINMHVIAFAGMRGAVAFSLAYIFPDDNNNRDLVLCTTIVVVLVTSLLQGCLTEPLIRYLGVQMGVNVKEYMQSSSTDLERQLIYPLVLRPKPPRKCDETDISGTYSPVCGPCELPGSSLVAPLSGSGQEGTFCPNGLPSARPEVPAPCSSPSMTAEALMRGVVGLHNFYHRRYVSPSPPPHHAYHDTMSSGGGSLTSSQDHEDRQHDLQQFRRAHGVLSPPLYPADGAADLCLPLHPLSFTQHQGLQCNELRGAFASFTPPKADSLASAQQALRSAAKRPVSAGAIKYPSPLIAELKAIIAQRNLRGKNTSSPPAYSGLISYRDAPVFNHLRVPNAYMNTYPALTFSSSPWSLESDAAVSPAPDQTAQAPADCAPPTLIGETELRVVDAEGVEFVLADPPDILTPPPKEPARLSPLSEGRHVWFAESATCSLQTLSPASSVQVRSFAYTMLDTATLTAPLDGAAPTGSPGDSNDGDFHSLPSSPAAEGYTDAEYRCPVECHRRAQHSVFRPSVENSQV